jgi:hypothetical protein
MHCNGHIVVEESPGRLTTKPLLRKNQTCFKFPYLQYRGVGVSSYMWIRDSVRTNCSAQAEAAILKFGLPPEV